MTNSLPLFAASCTAKGTGRGTFGLVQRVVTPMNDPNALYAISHVGRLLNVNLQVSS
jgi:hypothetical protein